MADESSSPSGILERLHEHGEQRDVQQRFVDFFQSRCGVFAQLDDADDEQPLEAMQAFKDYERLFEEDVAQFLESEETSAEQFAQICEKVRDDAGSDSAMLLEIFLSGELLRILLRIGLQ